MPQSGPPKGRFVWHELLSHDPDAAIDFYQKVIGWRSEAIDNDPNNYRLWKVPGVKPAMGGLLRMPAGTGQMPPAWLMYVAVPSVDESADEARRLGGTVHKTPTDIPGYGRFAVLADPHGAAFAIFTPGMPGEGSDDAPVGDFSWHELASDDWKTAWDFYAKLFGWEKDSEFDMGPEMGTYFMFRRGGGTKTLGGMFTKSANMPWPANWTSYIRVKDAKAVAKLAERHGGKIVNGPMEVPGGDWIAQLMDAEGAMFAVHTVAADMKQDAGAAGKTKAAAGKAPAPKKKAAARKPAKKAAAGKKAAPKKPAPKKKAARTAARKPATRKVAGKKTARKKAAKKTAAKKQSAKRRR